MGKPRFFIAVYGDPKPDKDPVESGVYAPDPKFAPFPAQPGDMMLLYCTASYPGYPLQVPGIGVVLNVDRQRIGYRWLPFAEPMPKSTLDANLESGDATKFSNIRFSSHWLFEISAQSFSRVMGKRSISWTNLENARTATA